MTGILRKTIIDGEERSRSETAAKLEFFNFTQDALDSANRLNMAQLEQAFDSISNENNSPKTVISLDLGLYLPAKRLQMALCELKNILL